MANALTLRCVGSTQDSGVPGAPGGAGIQSWNSGLGTPVSNTGDFSLKTFRAFSLPLFLLSAFKYVRNTHLQSVIHILVLNIRNLKTI